MPVTGLTITYEELRQQAATLAFGTDLVDGDPLSGLEERKLERWILGGLRRFYYPPGGANGVYRWRFLESEFTFVTDVNTMDYPQPPTFGGTKGDLVHIPSDNVRLSVRKVTPDKILEMRQLNISLTNYPFMYAERARHTGGTSALTWEIMVWPPPSGVYTFKGVQIINPLAPGPGQEYPYGGPEHAQTIIAAVLAEVELKGDGTPGPYATDFLQLLETSKSMDMQMHAPETLGINTDPSTTASSSSIMRDGLHYENFNDVTVGGVRYSG